MRRTSIFAALALTVVVAGLTFVWVEVAGAQIARDHRAPSVCRSSRRSDAGARFLPGFHEIKVRQRKRDMVEGVSHDYRTTQAARRKLREEHS